MTSRRSPRRRSSFSGSSGSRSAASSGLFVDLGYLAHWGRLELTCRQAQLGLAGVCLVGVAPVGADVAGAQPTHSATFEESIEVPDQRESVHMGTVAVENPPVLPRTAETPRWHACL